MNAAVIPIESQSKLGDATDNRTSIESNGGLLTIRLRYRERPIRSRPRSGPYRSIFAARSLNCSHILVVVLIEPVRTCKTLQSEHPDALRIVSSYDRA